MEKIFFHVTTKENLSKIRDCGFITPQIGPRSKEVDEKDKQIFLFTSFDCMQDALFSWLFDSFDENDELVYLSVKEKDILSLGVALEINCCEFSVFDPLPISIFTEKEL